MKDRLALYRNGLAECAAPVGKFKNEQAATFTMVHCAESNDEAFADAAESFPWYVQTAVRHIASLPDWMAELGSYGYAGQLKIGRRRRRHGASDVRLPEGLGLGGRG